MPVLAGKLGGEKIRHEVARKFRADDTRPEHQDVHVVVLDSLVSGVSVVAHRCPDAAHLVRRYARAYAAAADEKPAVGPAGADNVADRFGVVRVIVTGV